MAYNAIKRELNQTASVIDNDHHNKTRRLATFLIVNGRITGIDRLAMVFVLFVPCNIQSTSMSCCFAAPQTFS